MARFEGREEEEQVQEEQVQEEQVQEEQVERNLVEAGGEQSTLEISALPELFDFEDEEEFNELVSFSLFFLTK